MDPHAVLGLDPGASPEEVQRAYRSLAKRFHPDRAGDGELMISINAAYDLLRERLEEESSAGARGGANGTSPPNGTDVAAAPPTIAGAWLAPAVRRVLARELLQTLETGEQVDEIVLTATSDSHDVQLAVTDRRLLWLRDDAIMGRVRYLRWHDLADVEARPGGRFRRGGQLRVQQRASGRWQRFFDLKPDVLARLAARIQTRANG
ncbi:J domain-containing protein [Baekduia sp. Peel2402]|uniref:J domain-containing protein n=1 Tax=Baekduia sp. Peel2402 TaxID=3458296 RepID=UPI00403E9139